MSKNQNELKSETNLTQTHYAFLQAIQEKAKLLGVSESPSLSEIISKAIYEPKTLSIDRNDEVVVTGLFFDNSDIDSCLVENVSEGLRKLKTIKVKCDVIDRLEVIMSVVGRRWVWTSGKYKGSHFDLTGDFGQAKLLCGVIMRHILDSEFKLHGSDVLLDVKERGTHIKSGDILICQLLEMHLVNDLSHGYAFIREVQINVTNGNSSCSKPYYMSMKDEMSREREINNDYRTYDDYDEQEWER